MISHACVSTKHDLGEDEEQPIRRREFAESEIHNHQVSWMALCSSACKAARRECIEKIKTSLSYIADGNRKNSH